MLLEERDALREGGRMARRAPKVVNRGTFWGEQAMLHRHQDIGDGAYLWRARQRVPSTLDSADGGILDRNNTGVGGSFLDGANSAGEGRHRNQLHRMPPDFGDCVLGV